MDDHHRHHIAPPLTTTAAASSWPCFWEGQEEAEAEELKQALLRTTLELESTRLIAQEELKKMESQALHLAHLLEIATRERDEARHQCYSLLLYLSNHQQLPPANPNPNPNANPDESSNVAVPAASSSSEGEEISNVSSPPPAAAMATVEVATGNKGLPEKGRLVEAVMRAGPLLQTLLLAGPLPQWRHPPPAMQSFEIPPVSICLNPNNKEKEKEKDMKKRKKNKKREREEWQHSPTPSPVLNSTSSPESNGSSKYQQLGLFRV